MLKLTFRAMLAITVARIQKRFLSMHSARSQPESVSYSKNFSSLTWDDLAVTTHEGKAFCYWSRRVGVAAALLEVVKFTSTHQVFKMWNGRMKSHGVFVAWDCPQTLSSCEVTEYQFQNVNFPRPHSPRLTCKNMGLCPFSWVPTSTYW